MARCRCDLGQFAIWNAARDATALAGDDDAAAVAGAGANAGAAADGDDAGEDDRQSQPRRGRGEADRCDLRRRCSPEAGPAGAGRRANHGCRGRCGAANCWRGTGHAGALPWFDKVVDAVDPPVGVGEKMPMPAGSWCAGRPAATSTCLRMRPYIRSVPRAGRRWSPRRRRGGTRRWWWPRPTRAGRWSKACSRLRTMGSRCGWFMRAAANLPGLNRCRCCSRGLVSLCGEFGALEDQLAGLQAGGGYEGPGRSPDRADAMVWAITALSETRSGVPRVRGL